ncbi:conserved hypothetical protein [Hyella patelloides LEGE 07179]|uniref:Uncharacterized protein n=1 Tax=Hyella patelloides LEGE 07179 TaxID=945734 RepID=A0A563VV47_9CYAN|nr:hypothetical protein [Hyella patelloides]VEP15277.1 conserved hypothetical protein [Hyella patelloides LEGE 07179]
MATSKALNPSFLRDAFTSYSKYNTPKQQELQQYALQWLQSQIESELDDGKAIMEKFTGKWRKGWQPGINSQESPIELKNLPHSYKGSNTIDSHQEDALVFIHEAIPQNLKDDFAKLWNIKEKLQVSNADGAIFMVNDEEIATLKEQDPEGNGTAWYQVDEKQTYYLLSSEEKGDRYLVVLSEAISPQNRDTWLVAQADVNISKV